MASFLALLPTELVLQICTSLCLHCQVPRIVDASPDVVSAALPRQTALSRLSQTCKRLQSIAQPVLFHWYHARQAQGHNDQRRRLAAFVFTTLRRADLCAAVQAISVLKPDIPIGQTYAEGLAESVHDADGLYRRAAARLGGHLLRGSSERPTLEDFIDMAIAAAGPTLTQLCLPLRCEWGRTESWCWMGWPYPLPSLACLALRSADRYPLRQETYHLYQARNLIRQAPNLQTLIAPDCAAGSGTSMAARFVNQPWDVPLAALRRLSLSGMEASQVATILAQCPLLEDLEYFDDDGDQLVPDMLQPESHLGHVKGTLRRLCYSLRGAGASAQWYGVGETDDGDGDGEELRRELDDSDVTNIIEYPDYLGPPDGEATLGLSFASFPVLQVLELEQLVLCGPCLRETDDDSESTEARGPPYGFTMPEDFFARLPPSIRRLRIGAVFHWPTVYRDLLALADQASRFPRLVEVGVEVFKVPPREDIEILTDTLRVAAAIVVSVSRVRRCPLERGLLPARPGHPELALETLAYP
jgi:hypothetical protein